MLHTKRSRKYANDRDIMKCLPVLIVVTCVTFALLLLLRTFFLSSPVSAMNQHHLATAQRRRLVGINPMLAALRNRRASSSSSEEDDGFSEALRKYTNLEIFEGTVLRIKGTDIEVGECVYEYDSNQKLDSDDINKIYVHLIKVRKPFRRQRLPQLLLALMVLEEYMNVEQINMTAAHFAGESELPPHFYYAQKMNFQVATVNTYVGGNVRTTEDAQNLQNWLQRFNMRGMGTKAGFRVQGYDLSKEKEFMTLQRENFCNEATTDNSKLIKWKEVGFYLDTSGRHRPQWLRDEITTLEEMEEDDERYVFRAGIPGRHVA
jgi:hypothetical protein